MSRKSKISQNVYTRRHHEGPYWMDSRMLQLNPNILQMTTHQELGIKLFVFNTNRYITRCLAPSALQTTRQILSKLVSWSWWRHQMETFSTLLAICAGNAPVTGEFPAQRPVTRNFDVFFDLHPNKRLSKQSWDGWFETLSCPLWRRSNVKKFLPGDLISTWTNFNSSMDK